MSQPQQFHERRGGNEENHRSLFSALMQLASGRPDILHRLAAAPKIKITGFELLPVRASERTVWLFVRLQTDAGLVGLGEASDAFGFANTTRDDALRMRDELKYYFSLLQGRNPLDSGDFFEKGWSRAAGDFVAATAMSAMEQTLWDVIGRMLDLPVHALLGAKLHDSLSTYANINRVTKLRTPEGFAASAKAAVAAGFRAVKAAPFDGFPKPGSSPAQIEKAIDLGIACIAAMRQAVGDDVDVMLDCHAFFDVPMAQRIASRLESCHLAWFEEPVAPEKVSETLAIRRSIRQPMAGGELLFGVAGFSPLCQERAVDLIMPDVKHCGGILALHRIAAFAKRDAIAVGPHNPSGPVATAASVQVCAGMKNFRLLELQWGEVPWRAEMVWPPEQFVNGKIHVPDAAGFGITLNDDLAKQHAP